MSKAVVGKETPELLNGAAAQAKHVSPENRGRGEEAAWSRAGGDWTDDPHI